MRTSDPDTDPRWSCNRKKAYPSERIAQSAARSAMARAANGVALVAYGCTHCGHWHIGRVGGG